MPEFKANPRYTQSATEIPASDLGNCPQLKGKYIFARQSEVESEQFWKKYTNVGGIVCCLRFGDFAKYPAAVRQQGIKVLSVDARSKRDRERGFRHAAPEVQKIFERGQDVVVHCRESYHRAPMVGSGLHQLLTGLDFRVAWPAQDIFCVFCFQDPYMMSRL